MVFDQEKSLAWLRRWDRHLWGINANYKQAARLATGLDLTPVRIKKLLWCVRIEEVVDEAGEVKQKRHSDWNGVIDWWRSPDCSGGPRKETTGKFLTGDQWDKLKAFVVKHKALLTDSTSTLAFIIRLLRSQYLPANVHIIHEVYKSRKLPLPIRELP